MFLIPTGKYVVLLLSVLAYALAELPSTGCENENAVLLLQLVKDRAQLSKHRGAEPDSAPQEAERPPLSAVQRAQPELAKLASVGSCTEKFGQVFLLLDDEEDCERAGGEFVDSEEPPDDPLYSAKQKCKFDLCTDGAYLLAPVGSCETRIAQTHVQVVDNEACIAIGGSLPLNEATHDDVSCKLDLCTDGIYSMAPPGGCAQGLEGEDADTEILLTVEVKGQTCNHMGGAYEHSARSCGLDLCPDPEARAAWQRLQGEEPAPGADAAGADPGGPEEADAGSEVEAQLANGSGSLAPPAGGARLASLAPVGSCDARIGAVNLVLNAAADCAAAGGAPAGPSAPPGAEGRADEGANCTFDLCEDGVYTGAPAGSCESKKFRAWLGMTAEQCLYVGGGLSYYPAEPSPVSSHRVRCYIDWCTDGKYFLASPGACDDQDLEVSVAHFSVEVGGATCEKMGGAPAEGGWFLEASSCALDLCYQIRSSAEEGMMVVAGRMTDVPADKVVSFWSALAAALQPLHLLNFILEVIGLEVHVHHSRDP